MKLQYPAGVPLDDLDVGQTYVLTMRNTHDTVMGELHELRLKRRCVPRLIILPTGKPHVIEVPISKVAEIAVAEVDLTNSDYDDS
jgi:hypothetical protein